MEDGGDASFINIRREHICLTVCCNSINYWYIAQIQQLVLCSFSPESRTCTSNELPAFQTLFGRKSEKMNYDNSVAVSFIISPCSQFELHIFCQVGKHILNLSNNECFISDFINDHNLSLVAQTVRLSASKSDHEWDILMFDGWYWTIHQI